MGSLKICRKFAKSKEFYVYVDDVPLTMDGQGDSEMYVPLEFELSPSLVNRDAEGKNDQFHMIN